MLTPEIVTYIAEEVNRQGRGALYVGFMANAWAKALEDAALNKPLTPDLIESWGRLVEPYENIGGFRTCLVRVGRHFPPGPIEVRPRLEVLCAEALTMNPDVVYRDFEVIHPFRDGNGRTGKVVMNYLAGRLTRPVMPSNWFGCANP